MYCLFCYHTKFTQGFKPVLLIMYCLFCCRTIVTFLLFQSVTFCGCIDRFVLYIIFFSFYYKMSNDNDDTRDIPYDNTHDNISNDNTHDYDNTRIPYDNTLLYGIHENFLYNNTHENLPYDTCLPYDNIHENLSYDICLPYDTL